MRRPNAFAERRGVRLDVGDELPQPRIVRLLQNYDRISCDRLAFLSRRLGLDLGQIVAAAARMYVERSGLFIRIGLLLLPISLLVTLLQALVLHATSILGVQTGWLVNVVAGVVYAVTMPFVALTTAYVYFDARVRHGLVDEADAGELPAEIGLFV